MVEDSNATSDQRRFRMYSSSQKAHFDIPNDAFNSATDVMAVDLSNGYVGIGTTAPDHLLHVSQTAASGMGMLVYRNKNAANSDNALAKIHNDHIDDDQAALHVRQDSAGYAIHVECNTNTTNYGNGIAISTQDENNTSFPLYIGTNTTSVEAGNARFVVRADGKVGIGTSAPNTHLEVSDGVPTFRLNSTEGNVGDTDILGEISWKSADANRTGDPIAYIRALSENATGSATGLAFGTGFDSNNASERMRIKNSGNVGIGTTNPATALTVSGAFGGDTNFLSIISTGTVLHRNLYFTNTHLYFYNGTNNPYLSGTGAWTDASDENIKKNIEDIDYGLETINTLKPRKFKHKADDVEDIGFIAQEVELIVPEVVAGGPDESAGKGLAYGRLTSILTKAVQELSAKNDALEAKVKALEDA